MFIETRVPGRSTFARLGYNATHQQATAMLFASACSGRRQLKIGRLRVCVCVQDVDDVIITGYLYVHKRWNQL